MTVALGLAFLTSTALWWLYFSDAARILVDRLSNSTADETGALGRDVYTYLHLPIIAGIVLMAVGDELVIAHPGEQLALSGALVTLVGPALYLVGLLGCLVRVGHVAPWPIVITAAVLVAAVPFATRVSGLATLSFVVIALFALAVVDHRQRAKSR